jgi:hypothetical protein
MLQLYVTTDTVSTLVFSAAFLADSNKNGRARNSEPGRHFFRLWEPSSDSDVARDYDSHVRSQPSAQLSQQPLSQLQSGQFSQQAQQLSPSQQLPAVAAGVVAANAKALVAKAPTAASDQNDFVYMIELTFWLM